MSMKKIVLIVGARPNFMKAFPVYKALKNDFEITLIHTGQHFDAKMSDIFFNQLEFPKPDIHLNLESKSRAGEYDTKLYVDNLDYLKDKNKVISELINEEYTKLGQLGEIRHKLEIEFEKIKPNIVMVFGDVTSTLSASLASKKLSIEIAHVESGLRSGDLSMPEEVNRILTDHISTYYFVTEQSGVDNLKKDEIETNVFLVGNTMIDCLFMFKDMALETKYYEKIGVKEKEYVLITLHRPGNVDDLDKLKEIFDQLEELSKSEKLVYPIHPRTKSNLEKIGYLEKINSNPNIILQEPLGYLEFTCLEANAKYVITDSGGIQEETTALNVPCFTLRPNTERPSTLIENSGTNQLINNLNEIVLKECAGNIDLWDGKSNERILFIIKNEINDIRKKLLICFGTRPEYIKVKSLIDNLKNIKTCFTGQHKDLLKDVIVDYKLSMDDTMSENRLNNIYCNILKNIEIFKGIEYVLVQGDTSTASAIALSAFNNGIKIMHLEAGLRSKNSKDPFPEEMNRQMIGRLADIHLCPTEYNKENLKKENTFGEIFVVGNTGLDNITKDDCEYTNKVLITMHRRDNYLNMNVWFNEFEKIANKYSDIEFIIPLHPNPNVNKHKHIFKKVKIVNPMTHYELINYLKKCKFVISDSGGLQEECSYLNKKIIVCRKTTERPESINIHSFMCNDPKLLENLVNKINNNYVINDICPYGDGFAWKKIVSNLFAYEFKIVIYKKVDRLKIFIDNVYFEIDFPVIGNYYYVYIDNQHNFAFKLRNNFKNIDINICNINFKKIKVCGILDKNMLNFNENEYKIDLKQYLKLNKNFFNYDFFNIAYLYNVRCWSHLPEIDYEFYKKLKNDELAIFGGINIKNIFNTNDTYIQGFFSLHHIRNLLLIYEKIKDCQIVEKCIEILDDYFSNINEYEITYWRKMYMDHTHSENILTLLHFLYIIYKNDFHYFFPKSLEEKITEKLNNYLNLIHSDAGYPFYELRGHNHGLFQLFVHGILINSLNENINKQLYYNRLENRIYEWIKFSFHIDKKNNGETIFLMLNENSTSYHGGIIRIFYYINMFIRNNLADIINGINNAFYLIKYPTPKKKYSIHYPSIGDSHYYKNEKQCVNDYLDTNDLNNNLLCKDLYKDDIFFLKNAKYIFVKGSIDNNPYCLNFYSPDSTFKHKHLDNLNFTLFFDNLEWIIDPGFYSHKYDDEIEKYLRGKMGHNSLILEGENIDYNFKLNNSVLNYDLYKSEYTLTGIDKNYNNIVYERKIIGNLKNNVFNFREIISEKKNIKNMYIILHFGYKINVTILNNSITAYCDKSKYKLIIEFNRVDKITKYFDNINNDIKGIASTGLYDYIPINTFKVEFNIETEIYYKLFFEKINQ